MVAEWVNVPAVWCDPWPGHVLGLWVRIPLVALVIKPLMNYISITNQLYSCLN